MHVQEDVEYSTSTAYKTTRLDRPTNVSVLCTWGKSGTNSQMSKELKAWLALAELEPRSSTRDAAGN